MNNNIATTSSTMTSSEEITPKFDVYLVNKDIHHGYCVHYDRPNLGEGSFGKIRLATHLKTSKTVAVKMIKKYKIKTSEDRQIFDNEILALQRLKHPNIARMLQHFETPGEVHLVLEYCSNNNLADYVRRRGQLQEFEVKRFMFQLLNCISFVHEHGFYHRNICPSNILLDSTLTIKLIGFQFTYDRFRAFASVDVNSLYSNAEFAPPEMLNPESTSVDVHLSGDVWCIGCVFYFMLTGEFPFKDASLFRLFNKIKIGAYPKPRGVGAKAIEFLEALLEIDPEARPTAKEALTYPFLTENNTLGNFVITGNVDENYIDRLDNEVVDICYDLHKDDVDSRANLVFNILQQHCYQTATYWLVKANIHEMKHRLTDDESTSTDRGYVVDRQHQQHHSNRLASLVPKREVVKAGEGGGFGTMASVNVGGRITRITRPASTSNNRQHQTAFNEHEIDDANLRAFSGHGQRSAAADTRQRQALSSSLKTNEALNEKEEGSIANENDYRTQNWQFVPPRHDSVKGTTKTAARNPLYRVVGHVAVDADQSMDTRQQQHHQQPKRRTNVQLSKLFDEVAAVVGAKEDAEMKTDKEVVVMTAGEKTKKKLNAAFGGSNRSMAVAAASTGREEEMKALSIQQLAELKKIFGENFYRPGGSVGELGKGSDDGDSCNEDNNCNNAVSASLPSSTTTTPSKAKGLKRILSKKLKSLSFRHKTPDKFSPWRKGDAKAYKAKAITKSMTSLVSPSEKQHSDDVNPLADSVDNLKLGDGSEGNFTRPCTPKLVASSKASWISGLNNISPMTKVMSRPPTRSTTPKVVQIVTRFEDVALCREKCRELLATFRVHSQVEDGGSKLRCCLSSANQVLLVFEIRLLTSLTFNRDNFIVLKLKWIRGSMQNYGSICTGFTKFFERTFS